jgi:hypothetical protein
MALDWAGTPYCSAIVYLTKFHYTLLVTLYIHLHECSAPCCHIASQTSRVPQFKLLLFLLCSTAIATGRLLSILRNFAIILVGLSYNCTHIRIFRIRYICVTCSIIPRIHTSQALVVSQNFSDFGTIYKPISQQHL